jgi:hypothetical protein
MLLDSLAQVADLVSQELFGGEEGTRGYELAMGVGVGRGQPASTNKARHLPKLVRLVPPWGECDVPQAGGGSQPEERHGRAAEIHKIDRRREKIRYAEFLA